MRSMAFKMSRENSGVDRGVCIGLWNDTRGWVGEKKGYDSCFAIVTFSFDEVFL
jgi:hypothetical protein